MDSICLFLYEKPKLIKPGAHTTKKKVRKFLQLLPNCVILENVFLTYFELEK